MADHFLQTSKNHRNPEQFSSIKSTVPNNTETSAQVPHSDAHLPFSKFLNGLPAREDEAEAELRCEVGVVGTETEENRPLHKLTAVNRS